MKLKRSYKVIPTQVLKDFLEEKYLQFNSTNCAGFLRSLKHIYSVSDSMEDIIIEGMVNDRSLRNGLDILRKEFFSVPHSKRTEKHFANIIS